MKVISILAVAGLCGAAFGDILAMEGARGFSSVSNLEDFESYSDFQFVNDPEDSPNGLHFTGQTGNGLVIWGGDGGVGFFTRSLYQNGGANTMLKISLTSGADIDQIQVDLGNGFGANPHNVWVRAYNNGAPVADFDFPGFTNANTLSVWATGGSIFDELRVQSMGPNPNLFDENQFGAVSVDNVTVGIGIPAPGAIATLGLAGLLAAKRRRA